MGRRNSSRESGVKSRFKGETVLRTRKKFGGECRQKENGKSKQGEDIKKKNEFKEEKTKARIEFRNRRKCKEKGKVM